MHKPSLRALVLVALVVAVLRTATLAAAPSPSAPIDTNGDMNVKITSQTLKYEDTKHLLILDGNVVVTHKDTVITAPHAEFLTDKQIGHFTGGVKITQPGTTITSKKLDAYYPERKAILLGSVQMVTEKAAGSGGSPQPSGSPKAKASPSGPNPTAKNLPTVVLADEVHYFWEKDEADAMGDVKIRQGDKRAFSDRGHYTGAINQIRLFSNVRFERGPKDWMIAEEATLDMKQNVFTAYGGVEATVYMNSSPSPSPSPLTTQQGDRVLRPAPPTIEQHGAPDGLPGDLFKPSATP